MVRLEIGTGFLGLNKQRKEIVPDSIYCFPFPLRIGDKVVRVVGNDRILTKEVDLLGNLVEKVLVGKKINREHVVVITPDQKRARLKWE